MPDKKQESFTVTDRRLFTSEGDLRHESSEEHAEASQSESARPAVATAAEPLPVAPPPSAAEQREQAEAYRKSSDELNAKVELSGHSAKDLEMTFERFLASLYMTAMLQLGLMHEEGGQPRIDLIAARQTIDTLSLIGEKTKGNLTGAESNFLQNSLYELRMAYVEVTNALAHPPQAPAKGAGK